MKATAGKANPAQLNELLRTKLGVELQSRRALIGQRHRRG